MASAGITPQQAANALNSFDQIRDQLITEGMNNGLNHALELSITKYMVGGSTQPGAGAAENPVGQFAPAHEAG